MRLPEVYDLLARDGSFPTEHETLAASLENVEVEAPDGTTTPLGAVFARTDERRYRSAQEAYATVLGTVGEEFVGRKGYDDRSSVTHHTGPDSQSF
ncbi:MAG: hypothetical protein ABEJ22_04030 [Haloferacaceae archaeon]